MSDKDNDTRSLITIFCPYCKEYHLYYAYSIHNIPYCPYCNAMIEVEEQKQEEGQMNNTNIKAGDTVKVIDWGYSCPKNDEWFLARAAWLKSEWIAKYAYGDSSNYEKYPEEYSDKRYWEVLFVDIDDNLALITEKSPFVDEKVYLIMVKGLTPATRKMTISEIEDILGYPVEIVG